MSLDDAIRQAADASEAERAAQLRRAEAAADFHKQVDAFYAECREAAARLSSARVPTSIPLVRTFVVQYLKFGWDKYSPQALHGWPIASGDFLIDDGRLASVFTFERGNERDSDSSKTGPRHRAARRHGVSKGQVYFTTEVSSSYGVTPVFHPGSNTGTSPYPMLTIPSGGEYDTPRPAIEVLGISVHRLLEGKA